MNHEEIAAGLVEMGYDATLHDSDFQLQIRSEVGGRELRLLHKFPKIVLRLPEFFLAMAPDFGQLAHVSVAPGKTVGSICVNDVDSVSVNSEVPTLAYEASLRRHLDLLERAVTDPEWNRAELLREFHSNWAILCARSETIDSQLYCAADVGGPHGIQIKRPDPKSTSAFGKFHTGLDQQLSTNKAFKAVRDRLNWDKRQTVGKSCFLELDDLIPAPIDPLDLPSWYEEALSKLSPSSGLEISRFGRSPSKEYWLVFVSDTVSGNTWFAIRFRSEIKGKLPMTAKACANWQVEPIHVRAMTREALMPRSGASEALVEKSALLVGCGAVGNEIAHRLASSGIGHLRIQDPDRFDIDNLYRHSLALHDVGFHKCLAVAMDLELGYPWIQVDCSDARLEALAAKDGLNDYDLIIVAIGSPTVERYFHKAVRKAQISTPILNTWVEAFGVGGHATIEIPGTKGCLSCAYVDAESLNPGLASNLNFLEANQDLTVTNAGCGNQFLPYSGIAASYTATMAADLAVQYFHGALLSSSRISWKGNGQPAEDLGFTLSHRYQKFGGSLTVQSLYNEACAVCVD